MGSKKAICTCARCGGCGRFSPGDRVVTADGHYGIFQRWDTACWDQEGNDRAIITILPDDNQIFTFEPIQHANYIELVAHEPELADTPLARHLRSTMPAVAVGSSSGS